jgi:hypothetical protein
MSAAATVLPRPPVARYVEIDLRFTWHARRVLELSVRNDLLHIRHVEFGSLTPPESLSARRVCEEDRALLVSFGMRVGCPASGSAGNRGT